ncbi:hypothetical protein M139_4891 [Bacteroides fragilis str. S23L24]|nr:hypothetical protein M139_4891 [Bacteroides fragilis str. S23L24]EYE41167.1 hypothetical protein M138_4895 [Bacteroides fragilis str. S23L17]
MFDNLLSYTSVRSRQRIAIHTHARFTVRSFTCSPIRPSLRTSDCISTRPSLGSYA